MKKLIITLCTLALLFSGCTKKESSNSKSAKTESKNIAVFVPGIIADSPTYKMLAEGVTEACNEYTNKTGANVNLEIMEAGTNQSEWQTKLTSLCAQNKFDVIVSSNPSLPELASPLTQTFIEQKFILMDSFLEGNENIFCTSYNQREQTFLAGVTAGLVSNTHKVALVAAQEYPVMNNVLYPYFAYGAEYAKEGTTCDFRIVGNWYDASKGEEITKALYTKGVDVILPICGGAAFGVIAQSKEKDIKLCFIDDNAFDKSPDYVVCSVITKQNEATKEAVLDYLGGKTKWGTTKVVGLQEGYIELVQDNKDYIKNVSQENRDKINEILLKLKNGELVLPEKIK